MQIHLNVIEVTSESGRANVAPHLFNVYSSFSSVEFIVVFVLPKLKKVVKAWFISINQCLGEEYEFRLLCHEVTIKDFCR